MPSAAELAWLIPVLPLAGACLSGLGLISFNRTVNRLRKPVALLLISCVGAAAVLSFAVLLVIFWALAKVSDCGMALGCEVQPREWTHARGRHGQAPSHTIGAIGAVKAWPRAASSSGRLEACAPCSL